MTIRSKVLSMPGYWNAMGEMLALGGLVAGVQGFLWKERSQLLFN
jgi:hypothetical protein